MNGNALCSCEASRSVPRFDSADDTVEWRTPSFRPIALSDSPCA